MLASNGVYSLLDKPTHISSETTTTIDHVITNDTHNTIYPCVFVSDISDHFPAACLVAKDSNSTTSNSRIKKDTYSCRDMSSFDPLEFKLDLSKLYNIHLRTLPLVSPTEVDNRDVPQGKLLGLAEQRVSTTILGRVRIRVSATSKYELKIR